jgi:hypothetical protein
MKAVIDPNTRVPIVKNVFSNGINTRMALDRDDKTLH